MSRINRTPLQQTLRHMIDIFEALPVKRLLFCVWCFGCASVVQALPDDEYQPIRIQANSALHNDKTGVTVYSGNVVLDQGSLHVTADKITVTSRPDAHGKTTLETMTAEGLPVHLQQQPTADKDIVYAEAKTINYWAKTGKLKFTHNAHLRQGAATMQSESIEYSLKDQTFQAQQSATAGKKPARVEIIIPPQKTKP